MILNKIFSMLEVHFLMQAIFKFKILHVGMIPKVHGLDYQLIFLVGVEGLVQFWLWVILFNQLKHIVFLVRKKNIYIYSLSRHELIYTFFFSTRKFDLFNWCSFTCHFSFDIFYICYSSLY